MIQHFFWTLVIIGGALAIVLWLAMLAANFGWRRWISVAAVALVAAVAIAILFSTVRIHELAGPVALPEVKLLPGMQPVAREPTTTPEPAATSQGNAPRAPPPTGQQATAPPPAASLGAPLEVGRPQATERQASGPIPQVALSRREPPGQSAQAAGQPPPTQVPSKASPGLPARMPLPPPPASPGGQPTSVAPSGSRTHAGGAAGTVPPPLPSQEQVRLGSQPAGPPQATQSTQLAPAVGAAASGIAQSSPTAPPTPNFESIEPWPPPVPSRYAVFPRISQLRQDLKTVGDFADVLHTELNNAGHFELKYWGAPNGFALVTRLEPIDEDGRPLGGNYFLASNEQKSGIFKALTDGARALVGSPVRRARIFLFVVTDDGEISHPKVKMTTHVGRLWEQGGRVALPRIDRTARVTENHLAAIFVYEFQKEQGVSEITYGGRSVDQHLAASGVKISGLFVK